MNRDEHRTWHPCLRDVLQFTYSSQPLYLHQSTTLPTPVNHSTYTSQPLYLPSQPSTPVLQLR
ncbi:hypothetical protein Hamer_G015012 [Homarus americanus]|uniref:Uncharacterized protein n=1 Tax=Homarus americanus TaxID=6706 RepID=A0A8J5J8H7_HOMAM|nr:hypothetical protein Hamer_G015012 [Homarus americanus]